MNNLTNVEFSAWHDGSHRRCRFSATPLSDCDFRYFDFYMSNHDWSSFAYGKVNSLQDGYMTLNVMGELCSVYRLDIPFQKTCGYISVSFVNFNFPLFVRKILLKWAKEIWTMDPNVYKKKFGYDRPVIKIDDVRLNRWCKLYGVGSGNVEIVMNEPCKAFLEKSLSLDNNVKDSYRTLKNQFEHIIKCARNQTFTFFQTSKLYLMKDMDGFYFQIERGMNGGIINHGKDAPSWSIHT